MWNLCTTLLLAICTYYYSPCIETLRDAWIYLVEEWLVYWDESFEYSQGYH